MSSNSRFVNMSSVDLDKLDSEKDSKSTKRTAADFMNNLVCTYYFATEKSDPDSTYLRTLEVDVCIPAKMREKAKKLCEPYMRAYGECAKREQLMLPFRCREVAEEMRQCLQGWYDKPDFQAEAKKEYLEERAEYRRTGITRKQKAKLEEEFPHT